MAKEEYQDNEQPDDDFQAAPEDLREDDEISDSEEAFMEGYEADLNEEEEETEKEDEFDI